MRKLEDRAVIILETKSAISTYISSPRSALAIRNFNSVTFVDQTGIVKEITFSNMYKNVILYEGNVWTR